MRKGTNGFEELKRYIKQGNDLCKDLAAVLNERCELEQNYARSLSKISQKMSKVASTCAGTVANSWGSVAEAMKREAEVRQEFASNMADEVAKPMKNLSESFHKARKPIEAQVDKAGRTLLDKRSDEAAAKKKAHTAAKDTEKAWDSLSDARIRGKGGGSGGSGDSKADKESNKQEKKCRSSQTAQLKYDRDYYDACFRAELARLEWEATVVKGSEQLQVLETDRLRQSHEMQKKLQHQLSLLAPAFAQLTDRLGQSLRQVDTEADIGMVIEQRGALLQTSEQVLFESYAEDLNNPMDKGRREFALRTYAGFVYADLERELKGKEGVEKLLGVYASGPGGFSDVTSQREASEKLTHILAVVQFLEANQYKLDLALHALTGGDKPVYRLASCLERSKDRQGMPQTILRLAPPALRRAQSVASASGGGQPSPSPSGAAAGRRHPPLNRGATIAAPGNGGGAAAAFSYDDMFDDGTYARIDTLAETDGAALASVRRKSAMAPATPQHQQQPQAPQNRSSLRVCGWARVLYNYDSRQPDELTVREGDVLSVLEKSADGWWLGEDSTGRRGIFPGSYVEEF
uniref:F-BAR domain-containing protein n=2 Tax=Macrostomum lignano TaxID=282301 RepID=A0A1I8IJL1_9PLAT